MKKNLIHIVVALAITALLAVSCKKDDIEIKKSDYNWQVDKGILDNDIRSRLGYDPRLNYILFDKPEVDMPMLSLGSVPDTRIHNQELSVRLLDKPYTKDVQVTFSLDLSLFDKIKSNYSGFEAATNTDLAMLKIDGTSQLTFTKTIPAGQTAVSFTFTTVNDITFNRRILFPFTFTINDKDVIIPNGKNITVLKVFPEAIKVTVEANTVNKLVGLQAGRGYVAYRGDGIDNPKIVFKLKSNYEMPAGVKFDLVYDEDAILSPSVEKAGSNVLSTHTPIAFDAINKEYKFRVKVDVLTAAKKYILPLKWQLIDAGGTVLPSTDNKLYVNFDVRELKASNDNVELKDEAEGTVMKRSGDGSDIYDIWSIGGGSNYQDEYGSYMFNTIDGDEDTSSFIIRGVSLHCSFKEIKNVKTIKIVTSKDYPIESFDVYADVVGRGTYWEHLSAQKQGKVTLQTDKQEYTIVFKKAVPASAIILKDFVGKGYYMGISELIFYEE